MRQVLLDTAKRAYDLQLMAATSGNLSLRTQNGMLITPSGRAYETMSEDDLVEINFDGNPIIATAYAPSSEWRMHAEIYRNLPDVNAIVHTHSPFATAFAVCHKPIANVLIEIELFLGGEIGVAAYAPQGTQAVGTEAVKKLRERRACLLANHGAVAIGTNMTEALNNAIYLEDAAKIYYYALNIGTPVMLTSKEK